MKTNKDEKQITEGNQNKIKSEESLIYAETTPTILWFRNIYRIILKCKFNISLDNYPLNHLSLYQEKKP